MSINLRILLFIFSIVWFTIIFILLKKDKMPIKYSLVWFLTALIILFVSIFPNLISEVTFLIGFQTTSNMITGIVLTLLLFITITLTIIVSGQRKKITLLIQEVSMLKEKNNEEK